MQTPAEATRQLIQEVAAKHGVAVEAVLGPSRAKEVVRARYEAIRRLRRERKLTSAQIGRIIGRDPTTVLYALGALRRGWRRARSAAHKKRQGK